MNTALAERVAAAGLTLAGSLLAVDPEGRAAAAGELWRRGAWAHADVIDGSYGQRASVTLDELRALAGLGGPLDVHLMVDDVAGWLAALPAGLARVTIQADRVEDLPAAVALARRTAAEVWLAVDPASGTAAAPREADGTLVMLVPPALAGHAFDPERLAAVVLASALGPSGVDGGVAAEHLSAIARAGARYAVVGRALYDSTRPEGEPR